MKSEDLQLIFVLRVRVTKHRGFRKKHKDRRERVKWKLIIIDYFIKIV